MSLYVNSAPLFVVTNFNPATAAVGIPFSFTIANDVTDPDIAAGDMLTFSKVIGPNWLNVAPDGELSGTPTAADLGPDAFEVSVVDLGGLSATGNFTIMVATEPPPAIAVQISLQGTNVLLSWTGGKAPYRVRMTTDLANPNWQNLSGLTNATTYVLSPTNVSSYYQIKGE